MPVLRTVSKSHGSHLKYEIIEKNSGTDVSDVLVLTRCFIGSFRIENLKHIPRKWNLKRSIESLIAAFFKVKLFL